jgi:hypothetical protein
VLITGASCDGEAVALAVVTPVIAVAMTAAPTASRPGARHLFLSRDIDVSFQARTSLAAPAGEGKQKPEQRSVKIGTATPVSDSEL